MTTKKLVPRASGEGGMGVVDNAWGEAYYDTGNFNKGLFVSGHNITQVIAETVTQGGLGGEWGRNGLDIYYNGGNVGIGTTNPGTALDIKGSVRIERDGSSPLLQFTDTGVDSRWMGLVDGTSRFAIYGTDGTTEQFVIDSSGKVGIGLANPGAALDVAAIEAPTIHLTEKTNNWIGRIGIPSATGHVFASLATPGSLAIRNDIKIQLGGSKPFVTIDGTSGNVGIGTTNPATSLEINKGLTESSPIITLSRGGTAKSRFAIANATNSILDGAVTGDLCIRTEGGNIRFGTALATKTDMSILSNGKVGIGNTNPSHDLTIGSATSAGTTEQRLKIYRGAGDPGQNLEMGYRSIILTRANLLANPQSTFSIFQKGSDGERNVFHIDTGGNIGLTTASPANKLVIAGSSDTASDLANLCPALAIENTFSNYTNDQVFGIIGFSRTGAAANVNGSFANGVRAGIVCRYEGDNTDLNGNTGNVGTKLEFKTSPTNAGDSDVAMTILGNGNVGIGISDPDAPLHVISDTAANALSLTREINVFINSGVASKIRGGALAATSPTYGGAIGFASEGDSLSGKTSGYLYFETKDFGGSLTEKMRINPAGNVGIGSTNPISALSVYRENTGVPDNTFASIEVLTKNTDTAANLKTGWLTQIGCYSLMNANGTGLSKNALIGVYRNSTGSNEAAVLRLSRSGTSSDQYFWVDDAGKFRTSQSDADVGSSTLGTVVGTQTSDERIKNIEDSFEYGLSDILKLKPIAFTFREQKDDSRKLGFGAQSVQPIIPESVFDSNECLDGYDPDPEDESGTRQIPKSDKTKLVMEYTQLIPVLTKAIQEQQQLIEDLRSEVEALKNK